MIQRIIEDDDGSTAIEVDEEGLEYLIEGLEELIDSEPGFTLASSAIWTASAPWWRFWDRSDDPVVGEFRLRKVE